MSKGNAGISAQDMVNLVRQENEFDELVSFVLSEMKRTALVHGFEDAVRQELAKSKKNGALSATLLTAPTKIELKRKLAEVSKEIEEGLGRFVDIDKRIAQIIDSGWMRDHVDDSIHRASRQLTGRGSSSRRKEEPRRPAAAPVLLVGSKVVEVTPSLEPVVEAHVPSVASTIRRLSPEPDALAPKVNLPQLNVPQTEGAPASVPPDGASSPQGNLPRGNASPPSRKDSREGNGEQEEQSMALMAPGKKRFKQMDPDAFLAVDAPPLNNADPEEDTKPQQKADDENDNAGDEMQVEDDQPWVPAKKRWEAFNE